MMFAPMHISLTVVPFWCRLKLSIQTCPMVSKRRMMGCRSQIAFRDTWSPHLWTRSSTRVLRVAHLLLQVTRSLALSRHTPLRPEIQESRATMTLWRHCCRLLISHLFGSEHSTSDDALVHILPDSALTFRASTHCSPEHAESDTQDYQSYKDAVPQVDERFHCPWEHHSSCNHQPVRLKYNYELGFLGFCF